MVEEKVVEEYLKCDIAIKKCAEGFVVLRDYFGLPQFHAFSTAEGLIEWLSQELGAGPIVWAWTLPIWAELVGVGEKDLLPMPDPSVNPSGYQEAQEYNASFLISRFADKVLEARLPPVPPEPKPKKEKKVREKENKGRGRVREDFLEVKDLTFPKGNEEEVKEE